MDGKRASVTASVPGQDAHARKLFYSRLRGARGGRVECGTPPLIAAKDDAHFFVQPAMRAEKPQPHRHRRDSQPVGNFLRRVLQNVAQQADLPQIGRKLRDRAGQQRAHLAPRESFFGIFSTSGELFGEIVPGLAAVFFQGNEHGIATLAKQVDCRIRGNARHPGVQVVLLIVGIAGELIEPREGLQHGLLARVFRVGRILRQPQCAPVKSRRIRLHKLGERRAVAPARFAEQAGTPRGGKVCLGTANCCCFQN